ncbi:MAG: hypothetical protein HQL13_07830 [Candidatus Omnitrophica bacterium]|nr:hypothetical protein [Candidatus Omnitrophota bacterium]
MKTRTGLILVGLVFFATTAMAQTTQTYNLSATINPASSIGIAVNSVNSTGTPVYTPVAGTSLGFGTLTFNTGTNTYLASNYFTIDITAQGGAGSPDTQVKYIEGTGSQNPNGTTNGFGYKTSIQFTKEVASGSTTTPTETQLAKFRLIDITTAQHILYTQVSPGWLRLYVGVCTGSTATDPTSCQAFTNSDATGTYQGQLQITATVH